MSITIFHKDDYPVSVWSGGTTTQLFIYPPQSDYARRDFLLRISSATVDCEQSTFTALPGVSRIILPLRGTLHLSYRDHGEVFLREYEQDSFDGGWETTSVGKATDFNLMTRGGAAGEVMVHTLTPAAQLDLQNKPGCILAVYAAEGSCMCNDADLPHAALAVAQETCTLRLNNDRAEPCRLVCVNVRLPAST